VIPRKMPGQEIALHVNHVGLLAAHVLPEPLIEDIGAVRPHPLRYVVGWSLRRRGHALKQPQVRAVGQRKPGVCEVTIIVTGKDNQRDFCRTGDPGQQLRLPELATAVRRKGQLVRNVEDPQPPRPAPLRAVGGAGLRGAREEAAPRHDGDAPSLLATR
jgi:hypothetical protein